MEKTILFQKNASVVAADGQQVGSLERVVLNPETRLVTDIVVRTGALFNKEAKVVPVEYIVGTTEDEIRLSDDAGKLKSFPPFEERHIVEQTGEMDQSARNEAAPVVYVNPGFGSMVAPGPGEQFVTRLEQNIPEGMVAMKEGAKVITADGKNVGKVERVLADSSVDEITHLLISTGMFTKEKRLIPMQWVESVSEDEVHLRLNKDSIEESAGTSTTH